MKRREFITLLGGAAAWPLAACAQQATSLPTVNKGHSLTENLWAELSLMTVVVVILIALAWRYVW